MVCWLPHSLLTVGRVLSTHKHKRSLINTSAWDSGGFQISKSMRDTHTHTQLNPKTSYAVIFLPANPVKLHRWETFPTLPLHSLHTPNSPPTIIGRLTTTTAAAKRVSSTQQQARYGWWWFWLSHSHHLNWNFLWIVGAIAGRSRKEERLTEHGRWSEVIAQHRDPMFDQRMRWYIHLPPSQLFTCCVNELGKTLHMKTLNPK